MDIKTGGSIARRGKKVRRAILVRGLLLIGLGLAGALGACSPVEPASPTQIAVPLGSPVAADSATPLATVAQTYVPATLTPALTATPPLSAVAMQGLKDAFNCLANNLTYAPNVNLTQFCPGYWTGSSANINTLDGIVIRKQLVPYLIEPGNIRWKLESLSDVRKDERLSTTVNPVYTGTLSTILSADVTLKCPSGTPAPFQTSVRIPVKGVARISVYDYVNQAQEYIQIESWTIQGDPLQEYCAALP
jgi:hypothetical protein